MTISPRLRLLGMEQARSWTELKEETEGALISLQIKKVNCFKTQAASEDK